MSLLEVILAIAILAGALVVLGEIVRGGSRSAQHARELAEAQFVTSSIMAEITAGLILPETTEGEHVDANGQPWTYSILVEPTSQEGLLTVLVTAHKRLNSADERPISCSLVRWLIDPQLEMDMEAAADEASAQAAESTGSDSASSSAGGSSSGAGTSPAGGTSPTGGSGGGR